MSSRLVNSLKASSIRACVVSAGAGAVGAGAWPRARAAQGGSAPLPVPAYTARSADPPPLTLVHYQKVALLAEVHVPHAREQQPSGCVLIADQRQ